MTKRPHATQIMYADTGGYRQIIRRARFLAEVLDSKKIDIDDNLIFGSLFDWQKEA